MKSNQRIFWISLAAMVVAEVLSFAAHEISWLQIPAFAVVLLVALVFSVRKLEYGLFFLIADQCLGSQGGRLFGLTVHGFQLSVRMGLFAVVMAVWVTRTLLGEYKGVLGRNGRVLALWAWLGVAWALGLARAFYLHAPLKDVVLDANAYVYALLVLPVVSVARRELTRPLCLVFAAGLTVLSVKSLLVFYWFSHAADNFLGDHAVSFYKWIRDTRVGEITLLEGSFPRVFIQSQSWLLLGLFGVLAFCVTKSGREFFKSKYVWVASIMTALVLGSFSRSFWVAAVLVAFGTIMYLLGTKKTRFAGRFIGYGASAGIIGAIILAAVMLLPFPYPSTVGSLAAFKNRFTNLDESALQSRWELAKPLATSIAQHPILGSGFGKRVTYITKDPRNLAINPTGEYSTYAFEWGYGDIWLKMGVLGLLAYGFILWNLVKWSAHNTENKLVVWLPLITLGLVHFFTPYLNHPLGIGVLLLYSGIVATEDTLS